MSHVASHILDGHPSHGNPTKQALTIMNTSAKAQRPADSVQRRKYPLDDGLPGLSLLLTSPDRSYQRSGSTRHLQEAIEGVTPMSAVESVFELPSAGSDNDTPNSSINSLSVVELEDTSPHPLRPQKLSFALPSRTPAIIAKAFINSSHLHPELKDTSNTNIISQLEQPQTPRRSVRSTVSQLYLHPQSPAAIANAELHFDQGNNPRPSLKSPQSHAHLRSQSTTSLISPRTHREPLQPLPPLPSTLSPHLLPSKIPHLDPSAQIKSRAAIVIETMTAIEEDNRKLLERAIAAERKADLLQEINLTLESRVANCGQHHRPKTAPPQSIRSGSEATPVSTFNTTPTRRRRPAPLKLTPETKSISRDSDSPAPRSPMRSARRPIAQVSEVSGVFDISGPIPGSVLRQQVTYRGTPISIAPPLATIPLAEARRRDKPLPYIMPLSPSAVPGYVEMGSRAESCVEEKKPLREKKTFGDMLRWGKRMRLVKLHG